MSLLLLQPLAVGAVSANGKFNAPTGDVEHYQYSEDSYSIQQVDKPSLDISKLQYEYSSNSEMIKMEMAFKGEPNVNNSMFYALYLTFTGDNLFTVQAFYSHYLDTDDPNEHQSNETHYSITDNNSTGTQSYVGEISTRKDDTSNTLYWTIDMSNFTHVFEGSAYTADGHFKAFSVLELNPGSDTGDYFIDQVQGFEGEGSGDTTSDEDETTTLPVKVSPVVFLSVLVIPIIRIYLKKREI